MAARSAIGRDRADGQGGCDPRAPCQTPSCYGSTVNHPVPSWPPQEGPGFLVEHAKESSSGQTTCLVRSADQHRRDPPRLMRANPPSSVGITSCACRVAGHTATTRPCPVAIMSHPPILGRSVSRPARESPRCPCDCVAGSALLVPRFGTRPGPSSPPAVPQTCLRIPLPLQDTRPRSRGSVRVPNDDLEFDSAASRSSCWVAPQRTNAPADSVRKRHSGGPVERAIPPSESQRIDIGGGEGDRSRDDRGVNPPHPRVPRQRSIRCVDDAERAHRLSRLH
jgi:hypothetical protein